MKNNNMKVVIYTGANGDLSAKVMINRPHAELVAKTAYYCMAEEGGQFHYGENELGLINFGLWYEDATKRPGHGGMWSSRASVAQQLTGVHMVDVCLVPAEGWNMAVHIKKDVLEALMADTEYRLVYGKPNMYAEDRWFISPKHDCPQCGSVLGDYEHAEETCRECYRAALRRA